MVTSATRGALRQRAHRARHNRVEKVEATLTLADVKIPRTFWYTIVAKDQPIETFYYDESRPLDTTRLIIFKTKKNLILLEKHQDWYADGPLDIKQLYNIPIIYGLLLFID